MSAPGYVGRFAPSPTGALHAGSLVAALASWLDARAQRGRWLLRFEDVDTARCIPGTEREILRQLQALQLIPDQAPVRQSERGALYERALQRLIDDAHAYPCGCTRSDIDRALAARGRPHQRHQERVYPGTCRNGLGGRPVRAWRARVDAPGGAGMTHWHDRRLGAMCQDVVAEVGDFVLRRADGCWAYQLAVVVDDAQQGVTHVVRGEDLADNTARQIHLQRLLGVPAPLYLHAPMVRDARGEKLSKQHGATPIDPAQAAAALCAAADVLGLPAARITTIGDWLAQMVSAWSARHPPTGARDQ